MITFNKTHLVIGEELITPKKIDSLVVVFSSHNKGELISYLDGCETSVLEDSTLITPVQKNIMWTRFELDSFKDKNILQELHTYFVKELQKLNPDIELTISEL